MSAGATAIPMKTLAAKRLPKLLARPAHMDDSTSKRMLPKMMGRRPNVLASGTHQMLAAPIIRTLTWVSYILAGVYSSKGFVTYRNQMGQCSG